MLNINSFKYQVNEGLDLKHHDLYVHENHTFELLERVFYIFIMSS